MKEIRTRTRPLKPTIWLFGFLMLVVGILVASAALVWIVDPYFHYRAPQTDRFTYVLDSQRFQNDGIVRHFPYRALITGSSMCENFKASDVRRLWGLETVKVPFGGATYRELARIVRTAARANPDLELVIVGLDFNKLIVPPDWMRTDLGTFPHYLYDDNPWNDASYLLNRDAVWKALQAIAPGRARGITSFDDYSSWKTSVTLDRQTALLRSFAVQAVSNMPQRAYSKTDAELVAANIRENLEPIMNCGCSVLLFLTPYSAIRPYTWMLGGGYERQLAAERQLAEAVFRHPNVRLFSFNARTDVTGDLANYRDIDHYGDWINARLLEWMHTGEGELTRDNLAARIESERQVYRAFDYRRLFGISRPSLRSREPSPHQSGRP